ncbi:Rrf2 family transcriptional regulator [Leucothrix pacifica]|uniref:Fe-S cluster assembly transcriptional regulator IscR n=1 Tax=Leucothrix pacifica TaxID=1247513 RepID=A0A317C1Q8_9GAMM|nr:Rrf2 family transcriptional regulator [Leucothrix pacifica]PWQ92299.1 Fe-S cluster assembly transcriptional regulator IscR [Leucothrix pacifica]
MKLSSKGQYAIQAMLKLAIFSRTPVTLNEISNSQSISISYLEQLFSMLRRSGLVEGVRGPGGGYRLSKSPNLISIADIVNAVEDSSRNKKLDEHSNSTQSGGYITNQLWNDLSEQLTAYLDSISLGDVVKDQVVVKVQYQPDETTRRIATMFPVTEQLMVA